MKTIHAHIGILIAGLLCMSTPLFAGEVTHEIPAWILAAPDNTASGCSSLVKGSAIALKIAKAKAMAELGRSRNVNLKSSQEFEKTVSDGKLTSSTFKETTSVTSNENFASATVLSQSETLIDGVLQLCVLVEVAEPYKAPSKQVADANSAKRKGE